MIEQGLVNLIAGNAAVQAIAPTGGCFEQLPKDAAYPAWTHMRVSDIGQYTLGGPAGVSKKRIQIDCYSEKGADVLELAAAIDAVLDGYSGTLTDPDQTRVQGCFRSNSIDFEPDQNSRTYRRMLEYEVWT